MVDGFHGTLLWKLFYDIHQVPMTCHVNNYSSPKALDDHLSILLLKTYMLYSSLIFYLNQIPSNGTLLHNKTLDMTIQARKRAKKTKHRGFPSKVIKFVAIFL